MFGKKPNTIKLVKKEYECCQCHKKISDIYIKPENEEAFDESYPMCWPCFLELCDKASGKKSNAKETK